MQEDLLRRRFLARTGSYLALTFASRYTGFASQIPNNPFTLGVASGDPGPDGVVLWTRLAPDPLNGGGMPRDLVQIDWQVASDERMSKIVKRGHAVASPELAHCVHVEVRGLEPGRWYWYQFSTGGHMSIVGRTRTA